MEPISQGRTYVMEDICIESPLAGELIELSEVKDPGFSDGAMGRGAAVKPSEGKVYAPFDGVVEVLFPTIHAIGLKSITGIDILIHIGFDTVKLAGQHFTAHVKQGDRISKGQLLVEFDLVAIKNAGYDTTTPIVVTNSADYAMITLLMGDTIIKSMGGEIKVKDSVPKNMAKE